MLLVSTALSSASIRYVEIGMRENNKEYTSLKTTLWTEDSNFIFACVLDIICDKWNASLVYAFFFIVMSFLKRAGQGEE